MHHRQFGANTIIQSLWIGGPLSKVEQIPIKSFLANNHEYHLYTYGNLENVPEGVQIKDANEIIDSSQIFTHQKDGWGKGSYAPFADLWRYQLLHKKGGWWVDTDVVCLKHFDFKEDTIICSSWEFQHGELPNNCMLKLPKGGVIARTLCERSMAKQGKELKFPELGPYLVKIAVYELDWHKYVVPYYYFNPISWKTLICLSIRKRTM
jgi:hypothetical protein